MLLYRAHNVQFFGFTPHGNPKGREQALGLSLRIRGRGRWRFFTIRVYWPRRDLRLVPTRPPIAFEISTWLALSSNPRHRLSVKSYIRLKVGPPGVRPKPGHKVLQARRKARNKLERRRMEGRA